jgi:hypothetical protein
MTGAHRSGDIVSVGAALDGRVDRAYALSPQKLEA